MPNRLAVQIATRTPCCGLPVRIPATRFLPRECYDRRCVKCGRVYEITRTTIRDGDRQSGRVDRLDWEWGPA